MDKDFKKGINFDLNTEELRRRYEKGDWHNAYYDIRRFLEGRGFEHIQGSGYHSRKPMAVTSAMRVLYDMADCFPWINYCVHICTITNVPTLYDFTYVFEREAARIEEEAAAYNCRK